MWLAKNYYREAEETVEANPSVLIVSIEEPK
jgi:hypothetical protein